MNIENSEKILVSIPKMQKLSSEKLDLISSAIDSCLAVQALEEAAKNPLILKKIANSVNC